MLRSYVYAPVHVCNLDKSMTQNNINALSNYHVVFKRQVISPAELEPYNDPRFIERFPNLPHWRKLAWFHDIFLEDIGIPLQTL